MQPSQAGVDHQVGLPAEETRSLHVPLLPETRLLIDEKRIVQMPTGAIVINSAHAGLMVEHAASDTIRMKHLGEIFVEVYDQKPPQNSPLTGLDNIIATPHTVEAMNSLEETLDHILTRLKDDLA